MKYIRMKDGTIVDTSLYKKVVEREFNGEVVTIDLNHWGQGNNKAIQMIKVKDITKQADIIEELCDEFIWIWNEKEYPYSKARQYVRYSFGDLKREMRDQLNYGQNINLDYIIFGAIWTDKGLIYVAKMNGKGELELI